MTFERTRELIVSNWLDTRRGIPYLHSPTYYSLYLLEQRSRWSSCSVLHRHVRIQRSWDDRKIVTSPLMLTLNSTRLASISFLLGCVLGGKSENYCGPKVPRQPQFDHGNFNLTTAISIWPRQFNLITVTSILLSPRQSSAILGLFVIPLTVSRDNLSREIWASVENGSLIQGVSRKLRPQTLKTQTLWGSRKLRP